MPISRRSMETRYFVSYFYCINCQKKWKKETYGSRCAFGYCDICSEPAIADEIVNDIFTLHEMIFSYSINTNFCFLSIL